MEIFISLLWSIFGVINFFIIYKDITKKIIPNSLLILLIILSIPLWLLNTDPFSLSIFFVSMISVFFISFILYYFGFWSPGDAKYLLVLSLFIPYIWIFSFISNIVIVTLLYLCAFFIFLLFAKGVFIKKDEEIFLHQVLHNVWVQQLLPIKKFIEKPNMIWTMRVINSINIFLATFVLIRLSRIFIFDTIKEHSSRAFQENYKIYITIALVLWMIGIIVWVSILWRKIKIYLLSKKWYIPLHMDILWSNILFVWVAIFIYYDYMQSPDELIANMRYILSFYIAIFIATRCLIYLYKFTFIEMEKRIINVKKLQVWDIIHRHFLIHTLIPMLRKVSWSKIKKEIEIVKNIRNKVDKREIKALKKVYKSFSKDSDIPIIETFAFSPHIFIGFIVSIFWGNAPIRFIVDMVTSLL